MKLSSVPSVTLLWVCLWVSIYTHKTAAHRDIRGNAPLLQTLGDETNPLQVQDTETVASYPGQRLELQCPDEERERPVCVWQTPFGSFQGCNYSHKDPVKTCNRSLRISVITSSHDGLYICVCQDETGKTILPYRVHVVGLHSNTKKQLRKTREAEVYDDTVPDSHFVAAVTSSVIVTFCVAFTLGTCSRSYVVKCLQMTKSHIPCRKGNLSDGKHLQPSRNTKPPQFGPVLFHKHQHTGEDTVDIMESQVDQNLVDQEIGSVGNVNTTGSEIKERENKPNQLQSLEEQNQELKSGPSPHPKKKSRVIRVYNYDEEGNPYSHIKDSEVKGEDEVRPKLRTLSLTRLNTIMKQAESPDFSSVQEPTDVQSAIIEPTDQ